MSDNNNNNNLFVPSLSSSSTTDPSPRTGATSAPVNHVLSAAATRTTASTNNNSRRRHLITRSSFSASSSNSSNNNNNNVDLFKKRRFSSSINTISTTTTTTTSPTTSSSNATSHHHQGRKKLLQLLHHDTIQDRNIQAAKQFNNEIVYLEGPNVFSCAHCRTHLTSHDEIISKSFHGRHGRAFLFSHSVNTTTGVPEDRMLMTGLHSVCDLFCKRCKTLIGWTYTKAYEPSQKYKEGKFIIEKVHLHVEQDPNCYYNDNNIINGNNNKTRKHYHLQQQRRQRSRQYQNMMTSLDNNNVVVYEKNEDSIMDQKMDVDQVDDYLTVLRHVQDDRCITPSIINPIAAQVVS